MALVLGTNSGFVTVAPTADPAGTGTTIDGSSVVTKHTSPANAVKITEIGWYRASGTNSANFEIALYSDVAGVADTRLFVDATNSSTSGGWITVAVDWDIVPNTAYWLGLQMDAHSGSSSVDGAASGGAGSDVLTSQTTLNNPYGGGVVADADGMYAIYALVAPITAALTGTITATVNEADIVAGGKTLIITLTNTTWIAAGAGSFGLVRDDIIAGCDSAQSEATGWDLVPKVTQSIEGVIRTSDTVVTITWDAFATYNISAQETITVTVPAAATVAGVGPVATPTFTIDTASAPVEVLPGTGAAVFTGFAPTVQTPRNVTPGTGQVVFTGFAPTVQTPRNITPGTGQLVFTGFAPTIEIGEPPPPSPPETITGVLATMFYALRRRKMKQVRV